MNGFKSSGRWFIWFQSSERKNRLSQKLRKVMWTFSSAYATSHHLLGPVHVFASTQLTSHPKRTRLTSLTTHVFLFTLFICLSISFLLRISLVYSNLCFVTKGFFGVLPTRCCFNWTYILLLETSTFYGLQNLIWQECLQLFIFFVAFKNKRDGQFDLCCIKLSFSYPHYYLP